MMWARYGSNSNLASCEEDQAFELRSMGCDDAVEDKRCLADASFATDEASVTIRRLSMKDIV